MSDVAVIGIPDLVSGELPKAFVVRRGDITSEELKQFVASKVPPEKKLRGGVEFVEKIPKSASGKILRRLLRKQEQQKSRLWLPELSTLLSVKLIDVVGSESSLEEASLIDNPEWDHPPCSAQWNF